MDNGKQIKIITKLFMLGFDLRIEELNKIRKKISATNEKDWLIELYKQLIAKAKDSRDFWAVAFSVAQNLEDKNWAKEILDQGFEKIQPGDSDCLRMICWEIIKELKDIEWAKEIIEKGLSKLEFPKDQACLGTFIIREFKDDSKRGKKIVIEALKKAEGADYISIGDSIRPFDEKWAREVYQQASKNINTSAEYCKLAHSAYHNLEDANWATELYKISLEKAESMEDYAELIIGIYNSVNSLNDQTWMVEIYQTAQSQAQNYHDFSILISSADRIHNGHEMIKEIYEEAVVAIDNYKDYTKFGELLKTNFKDKKWIKSVLKKQSSFYQKSKISYYLKILRDSVFALIFCLLLFYFTGSRDKINVKYGIIAFVLIFIFTLITQPFFSKLEKKLRNKD